jgi:hypothetical protein
MKNLQPNIHVNRLRNAYRQGTAANAQYFILQAMKRAAAIESTPREKTEIALESARVYRMIGEKLKAAALCDSALANIPAGCGDLIGELNRLRIQLHLDSGEYKQAETLLETTDGLEMTLHGNTSVISRKEENVRIETWLLAVETAIAQGKKTDAKNYFEKAIDKLTTEENEFHKRKLTVFEKRYLQTYFDDMRDSITLFGAVLQIQIGGAPEPESLDVIRDLAARLREKTNGGAGLAAVGNAQLLARCLVILREWNESNPAPPAGINLAEARRWYKFTSPIKYIAGSEFQPQEESLALADAPEYRSQGRAAIDKTYGPAESADDPYSAEKIKAIADIAESLKSLKELASNLSENHRTETLFQNKIAFAGHLMTIDIGAILRNVNDSHFTGFIKFTWKPSNYEGEIVLGRLSPAVEAGCGYLFAVDGNIIDATLGDMKPSSTQEDADRNFDLLIQLGWSIGLSDETPPDIKFDSIAEPVVEQRPRLMDFNHDALINRVTSITNRIFGITAEEEEGEFDMEGFDSAFMMNEPEASPPAQSSLGEPDAGEDGQKAAMVSESVAAPDQGGLSDEIIAAGQSPVNEQSPARISTGENPGEAEERKPMPANRAGEEDLLDL